MKLYAFQYKGYGSDSWYVMAEDYESAWKSLTALTAEEGWDDLGPEWYDITVLPACHPISNSNA